MRVAARELAEKVLCGCQALLCRIFVIKERLQLAVQRMLEGKVRAASKLSQLGRKVSICRPRAGMRSHVIWELSLYLVAEDSAGVCMVRA